MKASITQRVQLVFFIFIVLALRVEGRGLALQDKIDFTSHFQSSSTHCIEDLSPDTEGHNVFHSDDSIQGLPHSLHIPSKSQPAAPSPASSQNDVQEKPFPDDDDHTFWVFSFIKNTPVDTAETSSVFFRRQLQNRSTVSLVILYQSWKIFS